MILRVLFVISLMAWSVMQDHFLLMLGQLLLCIALLKVKGAPRLLFIRSLSLLLWLFLPIFLFHGVFTPGTYIQTPIYIPLSYEGLLRASMLCLHITLIFFSALLVFRLVKISEYNELLAWSPHLAAKLQPYLILMPRLKKEIAKTLDEARFTWLSMESKWLKLPYMLNLCVESMMVVAKQQAALLWKNWDTNMLETQIGRESALRFERIDILYGVFTWVVWTLWWVL